MIQIESLSRFYTTGQEQLTALNNISWSMMANEYVAITGASGSGKSTLMNIIGALDTPSQGKYYFQNKDISVCSSDELAAFRNSSIGFVFQHFSLIPFLSALENIMLPMQYAGKPLETCRARSLKMLEKVGLKNRAEARPSQLSGGQQQRIAIARALVNDPGLILADEPTGALDSKTTAEILGLFDDLASQGVALIVITHDMQVAARARRVTRLQDGHIVSDHLN